MVELGIAGFGISFLIHILIWRWVRPKRQLIWLAGIFLVCPAFSYFILYYHFADNPAFVLAGVLHILFSAAYILSYPAIQAPSPSLKIIRDVAAAMPRGLDREDLLRILEGDKPLNFCVDNLIKERLVWLKGDKLELSLFGRLVSWFFRNYLRWLGKWTYLGHLRFIFAAFLGLIIFRIDAYLFLVYGLAAYIYFHIYNMSQTARRIQILGKIGRQGIEKRELIKSLDPEDMFLNRISRLMVLNQLEERQGRYVLKGKMLLLPAKAAFVLRRLLFPPSLAPPTRGGGSGGMFNLFPPPGGED